MRPKPHTALGSNDAGPAFLASWLPVLAVAVLAVAQIEAAQAATQSVLRLHVVGTATIHNGPQGPDVVSKAEYPRTNVLSDSDLRAQAASGAPAKAAAPLLSNSIRRSGKSIPGKEGARNHFASSAGVAASSTRVSAEAHGLPPPPTSIPKPRNRRVVDASSHVFGFAGLTQREQRLAAHGNQFSLEPPDQALCAGNGFVVEAVNNAIAVYDTNGNRLAGPTALSELFGFAPEIDRTTGIVGPFVSDPKCAYDRETGRWFLTELAQDNGNNAGATGRNYNVIAVSQSSDPRGGFLTFTYDVTDDGLNGTPDHGQADHAFVCAPATGGCFGDQPLLGVDKYGVYQSTNEFGNGFNGAQIYAISKQGLIAAADGDPSPIVGVAFDAGALPTPENACCWYSVQPAIGSSREDREDGEGSSERGVEYFLSALQFGSPDAYALLDNRIAVWALSNTRSLMSDSPDLGLSFKVIASQTYGQPNPAAQKPGPTPFATLIGLGEPEAPLNTNDDRMNQVVYANGLLYGAVNTIIGDGSRTGIAWFAVKPTLHHGAVSGKVEEQGYVAVDGESVFFPSVAVNDDGEGLIAFALAGPDYFPSAAFLKIGGDDNSAVRIAANGTAPEDGFTCYKSQDAQDRGVCRWGDYSAATSDGRNIWWATEYIPNLPRRVNSNWGTWVGKIKP